MTGVLILIAALVGFPTLYFYVLPYVLDYLEDVVTHFYRRRNRRLKRKSHF